ncbi:MAG: hypothetical protein AMXMBFR84_10850 [Candidatus Hydrogenedentota bacterium]
MFNYKRLLVCLVIGLLCLGTAPAAQAEEVNLWISYYFTGWQNYDAGFYTNSETLETQGLDESQAAFREADTLDALGMSQTALGKYSEAEDAFQQALCLRETHCGPRSRFVPMTLNNLGDLHYVAGDREKCEGLYRRALDIHDSDQLNIEVCRALNGMALLHNDKGEKVEAENLLKRSMKIHEKAGRRQHPYMATNMVNLALLYIESGKLHEAKELLKHAEFIQNETVGTEHPDVAIRLHAYANLMVAMGKSEKARTAQDEANAIQAKFQQINAN